MNNSTLTPKEPKPEKAKTEPFRWGSGPGWAASKWTSSATKETK